MLVAVTGSGGLSPLIRQVIAATARPREDLDVLRVGQRGRALIASISPSPVRVTVPGQPKAPGPGASAYQQSQYQHAMTHWRSEVEAGRRTVAARTKAATVRWVHSVPLPAGVTGPPDRRIASLPGDCSIAASTVTGLVNQAGSRFSGRVVLLSAGSLSGRPAPGELDGDDVIAVTSYLPSAAAASAAQLELLAAGASFAAVLGPEATPAQLDHLVSEALSGHVVSQVRSGQALFANNSATLRPAAARVLAPIITVLRRPGASGVVNGFASTPGSGQHNQVLSQERASAVARYLEARGIPRSSLVVVGHGASNLGGPGFSGANRRVVVVIEEPTAGAA
jgi:outer membrane protein OmpA-like peptidoglycan-associated protein